MILSQMTNEPNKRFPRVSDCCKAKTHIFDDIKTQQVFLICSACDTLCHAVADEGLKSKKNPTLIINLTDSRCGNCGKPCSPNEKEHLTVLGWDEEERKKPGCGITWTLVSSDYTGMKERLLEMRPDLEWTDNFSSVEKHCTHGGVPGATWCTDCAACIHDPNYGHDFSKPEPQPSAPSMSLEEARKLLNNTDKEFQEIWETQERIAEKMIRSMELIDAIKKAASLLAASEQRDLAGKILTNMLEENLKNEYYFGVFGKVKNREFVENFKTNLSDSQQNISSKKSEL